MKKVFALVLSLCLLCAGTALADGAVFLMGDAQKIYEGDIEI